RRFGGRRAGQGGGRQGARHRGDDDHGARRLGREVGLAGGRWKDLQRRCGIRQRHLHLHRRHHHAGGRRRGHDRHGDAGRYDLAGNVGTAVTRSFDVNKGAAFSGNHFAVTYTGSAGTTLITSGSSTGSYTFTIPTLGSAATATISDGTRSYSTSSAIKAASGG